MSVALPRNPKIAAVFSAALVLSLPIRDFIAKRVRMGRDVRMLQMLPDNVLADIGLVKLDVGTDRDPDIRVIRHRYD